MSLYKSRSFCYTWKKGDRGHDREEISELYVCLAFQYKSAIDVLLAKGLIDADLATAEKEKFYDSLYEEKLQTGKKIRDYHETVSLYMRQLACKDTVSFLSKIFYLVLN